MHALLVVLEAYLTDELGLNSPSIAANEVMTWSLLLFKRNKRAQGSQEPCWRMFAVQGVNAFYLKVANTALEKAVFCTELKEKVLLTCRDKRKYLRDRSKFLLVW